MNSLTWNFRTVWDAAFEEMTDKCEKRDYIYASEIAYPFVEVWLKMNGTPFTNAPTSAARRKMEAGKLLEMVATSILLRSGILNRTQEKIDYALSTDLLSVHGKCDFVTNEKIDVEQSKQFAYLVQQMVDLLGMPEIYAKMADEMTKTLVSMTEANPGLSLRQYIIEAKSVSAFVYDLIEAQNAPNTTHKMQIFHYLHGKGIHEGKVMYINRDDVRLLEMPVKDDEATMTDYKSWIEKMTWYYKSNEQPPIEPLITFNPETFKFYKNTMGVEWSRYLTMLYGYESPQHYRDHITPMVKSMNYAFGRCLSAAKLTAKNKEAIDAAKKLFPNWDDMVDKAKLKGVIIEEENSNE